MTRLLIIDNHDSFVFNIVQLIRESRYRPVFDVAKNDSIPWDKLDTYQGIILSPGPGIPREAGNMPELIGKCQNTHHILGICLGHQAIIEHFGGRITNMKSPLHGHMSHLEITDRNDILFTNIPDRSRIGRYHSWCADKDSMPSCLNVTSYDEDGNIMSVKHAGLKIHGIQFHPESYITEYGREMTDNWINSVAAQIPSRHATCSL